MAKKELVKWFEEVGIKDVPVVGGKNASLGEMISSLKAKGVQVPGGFATTSEAYWLFVKENKIKEKMAAILADLKSGKLTLDRTGRAVRGLFLHGEFPEELKKDILNKYAEMCKRYNTHDMDVAVRSSATAEDLPDASFAGQQETFLNIRGEHELLDACRRCFASLFTDRAIFYRQEKGFEHLKVALSIGVQKMVRSDKSGSGVMFTLDTETGFPDVIVINAAYGLGEMVVQGAVNPDEYVVFKPMLDKKGLKPIIEKALGEKERKMVYAKHGGSNPVKTVDTTKKEQNSYVLTEEEILKLARWGAIIETHYKKGMDLEWAKDGISGELFIVQARPETVQSQKGGSSFQDFNLQEKGTVLIEGLAIGQAIATGEVQVIKSVENIDMFKDGSILVTGMTDPDWVPIMKRAAGIITDHGGRTSHAAIVSRELGIPALVGTGHATEVLKDGQRVTMSCAEGDHGFVYDGKLKFEIKEINLKNVPETKTQIMLNIGSPAAAMRWWRLPCKGIGLARMEFIINNAIKIHPMALLRYDTLKDKKAKKIIADLTRGYADKSQYFIDHLARGIARIGASQYPDTVIVRMSDFKTNEYANLIGGTAFEPAEDNPMIGFRGASRYYSDAYREAFALECLAIHKVREEMGLENVIIMIPFCRTLEEADRVLEVCAENGLKRGEKGLEIYVMAEIPSNVVLAEEFAKRFDGFSIGSNDLTQLTLGIDRDSEELASLFDERNPAVKNLIRDLIERAHKHNRKVGICGQAPSDYPEFAEFLVELGIDSISLNPDSVLQTIQRVAKMEKK